MPKPEKVLIVDDEPHVRDYISLLVQSSLNAPQVLKAADSTEALAQVASRIELGQFLRLGKGENATGGREEGAGYQPRVRASRRNTGNASFAAPSKRRRPSVAR